MNLMFALKLFLHSPNRYYTSLEFQIGNTKSNSWVETFLIPSNATQKKEKKKARMQPIQNAKGFEMKEEPKNMVILRICLILKIHCSNVQFEFFYKIEKHKSAN
jgi:hypothetical protein